MRTILDTRTAGMLDDIRAAAENMDCNRLENIFSKEDEDCIPEAYRDLFQKLRKASDAYEYEKILALL